MSPQRCPNAARPCLAHDCLVSTAGRARLADKGCDADVIRAIATRYDQLPSSIFGMVHTRHRQIPGQICSRRRTGFAINISLLARLRCGLDRALTFARVSIDRIAVAAAAIAVA